ncbi:MAG: helix-turn-helix domain-containing protein [Saprospiraceae bacterium]|nr:helix-turn-helix domain-containing protein [Saprospiraceae bacterium]
MYMDIGQQLLFFFSSLGVFNGFIIAIYFLFFAQPKRLQSQLLGALLLALSTRIGKSVLHFFVDDLSKEIRQIGLSACLFIGPFLYFYVRSTLNDEQRLRKQDWWQIIGLFLLMLIVGMVYSYPTHPELWNTVIVKGIYYTWIAYILFSARALINHFRKSKDPQKPRPTEKWLITFFLVNVLICFIFNTTLHFGWPSYIYGPIAFSFGFYALLMFLLFAPKRKEILQGKKPKYSNKKLTDSSVIALTERLTEVMMVEEKFKDPDLKLDSLSKALDTSPHKLSQLLNDNLGKSFTAYINEHRVRAACAILKTNHQLSLEGIGQEVGFRSKSSFYAAFKKQVGKTPSQFLKQEKEV